MKYTTVYVGMDVHKESFTLACYTNEKEEAEYVQRSFDCAQDDTMAGEYGSHIYLGSILYPSRWLGSD